MLVESKPRSYVHKHICASIQSLVISMRMTHRRKQICRQYLCSISNSKQFGKNERNAQHSASGPDAERLQRFPPPLDVKIDMAGGMKGRLSITSQAEAPRGRVGFQGAAR